MKLISDLFFSQGRYMSGTTLNMYIDEQISKYSESNNCIYQLDMLLIRFIICIRHHWLTGSIKKFLSIKCNLTKTDNVT